MEVKLHLYDDSTFVYSQGFFEHGYGEPANDSKISWYFGIVKRDNNKLVLQSKKRLIKKNLG